MARVLVVEDQRDLANLLAHNLRIEGLDVRTVEDGREVMPLVRSWAPDLVLLDLMLPGLDGYEVLEFAGSNGTVEGAARSDAQSVKGCDLHLAIVTYPSTGLGYELGVAQYCEKPVIAAAESGKRISRVVQGLGALNSQYYYVEYGSLKEIPKLVKDFFEKSPKRVRKQLLS